MKLCITSTGTSLDSNVDPRFGRCAYFLIYDTNTETFESFENESRQTMGGAGIQAGQFMSSKNIDVLITGNVGPNAFRVLNSAKVKIFTGASGTVSEAIEKYKNGQLTETSSPSVDSHFGTSGNF